MRACAIRPASRDDVAAAADGKVLSGRCSRRMPTPCAGHAHAHADASLNALSLEYHRPQRHQEKRPYIIRIGKNYRGLGPTREARGAHGGGAERVQHVPIDDGRVGAHIPAL